MASTSDDIERWLTHMDLAFEETARDGHALHYVARDTRFPGVPVEIFEPAAQPGVIVVGMKVIAGSGQIKRYLGFGPDERDAFQRRISAYSEVIRAVSRVLIEDGRLKIGVYVVIDSPDDLNQQGLADAIDNAGIMHEKMQTFLRRTF